MSFVLLLPFWLAAFLFSCKKFADWREAGISACVIWGALVFVLTEALSLLHAFAFVPLLLAWGLLSVASLLLAIRFWRSRPTAPAVSRGFFRADPFAAALVAGVSLIFIATLIVALASPPNNWDSMTYHMAKVANWIDHRSIHHYPTHILRQLYLGPWAESAITHLQILTGSDRLANLVQYLAMLGCALGASLVAKKLSAGNHGQLFAFIYSAAIPIGILEASTTQNDYVTAFWFLCFINFALDLLAPKSSSYWRSAAALAGASLGLAVLTKITALIFAGPFLLWVSYFLARTRKAGAISVLSLLAATALAINVGHLIRNERAFGSPIGPAAETVTYANEIHTPAAVSSNVIRNLAVHMAVPKIGPAIQNAIFRVHSLTGLDISDQRITAAGETFRYSVNLNENSAGNPFHLLLAAFSIALALWAFRINSLPAIYSICLLSGFVLFCGYLRWQPWVSRLHLPLFVALAPVVGQALSGSKLRQLGYVLSVIAIAIGLLYATKNDTRPLLGHPSILSQSRTDLYFASRPALKEPFVAAAAETARGNPAIIGIVTGVDDWEYPFWVLVRTRMGSQVQFEHINVQNESRNCPPELSAQHGLPDEIVVIGSSVPFTPPLGYQSTFASEPIHVFARQAHQ
jgi:Dolichyl-phosphate-mannose-protein mannosyltransferase